MQIRQVASEKQNGANNVILPYPHNYITNKSLSVLAEIPVYKENEMREKYESLSVVVLREVAKARGLTHLSGLKKSELVDLMVQEDEKESNQNNAGKAAGVT